MKTIAIIDDEFYFRQVLLKYIAAFAEQYTVIGEACNGADGIKLIDQFHPDIVLLDISMPQLNGFSVVQHALHQEKKPRFIIISGYDRFDYAQKAIRLGVEDFLLKPITPQNLFECLQKVSNNIDVNRSISQTLSALTQKEHRNKAYLVSTFMHRLMQGGSFSDELIQLADEIHFPADSACFASASLSITQQGDLPDKKTLDIYAFAAENILNELLAESKMQCIGTTDNTSILLLFAMQENTGKNTSTLEDALQKMTTALNRNRQLAITVCVDSPCAELKDIPHACRNILALQQYCIFYSMNGIYDYPSNSGAIHVQLSDQLLNARKQEISRCIRSNNYLGIITNSRAVFDLIQTQKPEPVHTIRQLRILLKEIADICMEYNVKFDVTLELDNDNKCNTLQEIQAAYMKLVHLLTGAVTNPVQPFNHITIAKVKNYIEDHFNEPELGSCLLSRIFNINEQHLCFLFKKHTDSTIGNYILNIRMQTAKQLLDLSNYNISETAARVGYHDAGYFSKCFKKYYGISPKHYITKRS